MAGTRMAKPFIKFVGGKTSLLPEILSRLPMKLGTYYEPFIGGGAVFFALASEEGGPRFKRAVIADSNAELVNIYRSVARNPGQVITVLKAHAAAHSESYFYYVRGLSKSTEPALKRHHARAARTIYLNKTCFNGLYRVNKKGEFNVPFGDYKNPTICDEDAIRCASVALRSNVDIGELDFESSVEPARRGDAVYFDPPYVPASTTSNFTSYTRDGFTKDDQERLRNLADRLAARGVYVLISNSDTKFVRELYDGFKIEKVQARRAINSRGDKRGPVGDLLITARE